MTRDEFRFLERIRVRWAEVDAQQIVFNAHYLTYFDIAIAGHWRRMALPYQETMRALEGDLYVRKATLEYSGSARYDELIDVGLRCQRIGSSSIEFACGVFRQADLLVGGMLIYGFADPMTRSPRRVPVVLRDWLQAFEAGEPMVKLELGEWSALQADASRIRRQVFIEEQRVPEAEEWDASDGAAVHAVAYNAMGTPLGTGRGFFDRGGAYRIGRMSVIASMRGSGVGRTILDGLLDAGRARGATRVGLSAQTSVIPFYERAGFAVQGEVYEDASIPHIEMTRSIAA
jgi:YbgC/YbaW family acyl-CoA thioester hydrolase